MPTDVNATSRTPFLQTPEALIDNHELTDSAVRLLQAMAKLPPRNARNSDAVARVLRMGKEKTNAARKLLRSHGHWHARKRQNAEGLIRDQRLASLAPLRTPEAIAEGWAAAEEAARLGKDTSASRRLGVRILNSVEWQRKPAAGWADARPTRRRLPREDQTSRDQTPLPVPKAVRAPAPEGVRTEARPRGEAKPLGAPPELGLTPLEGPLAAFAEKAERTLLRLRLREPRLTLPPGDARELAGIAGHHLLRGTTAHDLLTVLTQGLPPEGVRCPAGFVRDRLLRYLPPAPPCHVTPDWEELGERSAPRETLREPPLPEAASPPVNQPDGPAAQIASGVGWRDVLAAVRADGTVEGAGGADTADRRRP